MVNALNSANDTLINALSTIDARSTRPKLISSYSCSSKSSTKRRRKLTIPHTFSTTPAPVKPTLKQDPWIKSQDNKLLQTLTAPQNYLNHPRYTADTSITLSSPSVLFNDYDVGGVYRTTFSITNSSSISTHVRLVPPSSPYFSAELRNHHLTSPLAPGLSLSINVLFNPPHLASLSSSMSIVTSTETISIPITACRPHPTLTIPSLLDLGHGWVGTHLSLGFSLVNEGGRGKFVVMKKAEWEEKESNESLVNLSPSEFYLDCNEIVEMNSLINVERIGIIEEVFVLISDNLSVREFTVRLVGITPSVLLDGHDVSDRQGVISFPSCLIGEERSKKVTIRNTSELPIPFTLDINPCRNSSITFDTDHFDREGLAQLFSVNPNQGVINPQSELDCTVSFCSDVVLPSRFGCDVCFNAIDDHLAVALPPQQTTLWSIEVSGLSRNLDLDDVVFEPSVLNLYDLELADRVSYPLSIKNNSDYDLTLFSQNTSDIFKPIFGNSVALKKNSTLNTELFVITPPPRFEKVTETLEFSLFFLNCFQGKLILPCNFSIKPPFLQLSPFYLDFDVTTFGGKYAKEVWVKNTNKVSVNIAAEIMGDSDQVVSFVEKDQRHSILENLILSPGAETVLTVLFEPPLKISPVSTSSRDDFECFVKFSWTVNSKVKKSQLKSFEIFYRVCSFVIEPFIYSQPSIFDLQSNYVGISETLELSLVNNGALPCNLKLSIPKSTDSQNFKFSNFTPTVSIDPYSRLKFSIDCSSISTEYHENLLLFTPFVDGVPKYPIGSLVTSCPRGLQVEMGNIERLVKETDCEMIDRRSIMDEIDSLTFTISHYDTSPENDQKQSKKVGKTDKVDPYQIEIDAMKSSEEYSKNLHLSILKSTVDELKQKLPTLDSYSLDFDAVSTNHVSLGQNSCNHVILRRLSLTNSSAIDCKLYFQSKFYQSFPQSTLPLLGDSLVYEDVEAITELPFILPKTKNKTKNKTKSFIRPFSSTMKRKSRQKSTNFDPCRTELISSYDISKIGFSEYFAELLDNSPACFAFFDTEGQPISFDCPLSIKPWKSAEFFVVFCSNYPGFYQDSVGVLSNSNQILDFEVSTRVTGSPLALLPNTPNFTLVSSTSGIANFSSITVNSEPFSREYFLKNLSNQELVIDLKMNSNSDNFVLNSTQLNSKPFGTVSFSVTINPAESPSHLISDLIVSTFDSEPLIVEFSVEVVEPLLEIEDISDKFEVFLIDNESSLDWTPCKHELIIRNPLVCPIKFSIFTQPPFSVDNISGDQEVTLESNESIILPIIFDPFLICSSGDFCQLENSRFEVDLKFQFTDIFYQKSLLFGYIHFPKLATDHLIVDCGTCSVGQTISAPILVYNSGLSVAEWFVELVSDEFTINQTSGIIPQRKRFQIAQSNSIPNLKVIFNPKKVGQYSAILTLFATQGRSTLDIELIGTCVAEEVDLLLT
ncbi:hypothetical protein P9112_004585 [Eukaryota sp. TZLM1-RC]